MGNGHWNGKGWWERGDEPDAGGGAGGGAVESAGGCAVGSDSTGAAGFAVAFMERNLTRFTIIVLGLIVFCSSGFVAFSRRHIEAYSNKAPVILEIIDEGFCVPLVEAIASQSIPLVAPAEH